jgi:DNA-binding phage protein
MSKSLSAKRAEAREAAKQRRIENREWGRSLLDLVAAGHSYAQIADAAGVSVATIKRHVQRAIRQRTPEPADTFVALQRERLDKALKYTDLAMESGDLRAVAALVALLPQIERYWGLHNALQAPRENADRAHILAPNPMKSLKIETTLPPRAAELCGHDRSPAFQAAACEPQSSSAASPSPSSKPPSP